MKTTVPLTPCVSSQIEAFGYDAARNVLAIQFKGKAGPGATYEYQNVTEDLHKQFAESESKGAFFGKVLKDGTKFPYTKMVDDEEKDAA